MEVFSVFWRLRSLGSAGCGVSRIGKAIVFRKAAEESFLKTIVFVLLCSDIDRI